MKLAQDSIFPIAFVGTHSAGTEIYLRDAAARKLLDFFESKGLGPLKVEDLREQWYEDWIAYQQQHGLYATVLSPAQYSTRGHQFDLLRYARFIEIFGYCSPAHGYSLQVTFLGLFSILMGSNDALKHESVAALEAGKLLAFGVSEKSHGSDLLGNEFTFVNAENGGLVANGSKYYIGNTDAAAIISILGRKGGDERSGSRASRMPILLAAVRPASSPGFRSLGKIRTLGVRSANVGAFEIKDHPVPSTDIIAEGRKSWDAIFGTVTLGKFFLGFGSIGICEHAIEETKAHLRQRMLYGSAVIDMPHIRFNMAQAYARLTAMKLFAYRTLDYVHSASADDRRYLLFCAIQKAKVSTEGVKVMAGAQECIGARGFESDTYFEMALRDIQLIPSLEGSMHINLGLAVQFIPRYFERPDDALTQPPSIAGGEALSRENAYLMEAKTGALHAIGFPHFRNAYRPLAGIPSVAAFERQAEAFLKIAETSPDLQIEMAVGHCFAMIAYGQLVAENAARLELPVEITSAIFSLLVGDLSTLALQFAAIPQVSDTKRAAILAMIEAPQASTTDWDFVCMKFGVGCRNTTEFQSPPAS